MYHIYNFTKIKTNFLKKNSDTTPKRNWSYKDGNSCLVKNAKFDENSDNLEIALSFFKNKS